MMKRQIVIGGQMFDEPTALKMLRAGVLGPQTTTKNDPASTTPTPNVPHGFAPGLGNIGGTFSLPGVRPQRFSALARPNSILSSGYIVFEKTEYDQERIEILTGQTASEGSPAAGFCGDPPLHGNLKTCVQYYPLGDFYGGTKLDAIAPIGSLQSRADMPGEILNGAPSDFPFIPDMAWRIDDTRDQLRGRLYSFGVAAERDTAIVAIRGTAGATSTTAPMWMKQFRGLDAQIITGRVDAQTGTACPAADSAVFNYGATLPAVGIDGGSIVETLSYAYETSRLRAGQVGMDTTQFAIVIYPHLFNSLVQAWACAYWTNNCAGTATAPNNTDGWRIQELANEMRIGRYLLINGEAVPVIFDEGMIRRTVANNVYGSDVFIVPISWAGMPMLKWEYQGMDSPYVAAYRDFADGIANFSTLNDGMYLASARSTGGCVQFLFQARGRLILEAPFLASRVDNVQWTETRKPFDPIPGASLYVNGGVSLRNNL